MARIVRQAGLTPWPRIFHNLRSTRQTELEEQFPSHVVCRWIGNSQQVAQKHYLQVTDDHYQRAVTAGAKSGAQVVHNPAQQAHATSRTDSPTGQGDGHQAVVPGEVRPAREEKHEVRIAGRPLPTVSWTVSFGAHFRSLRWAELVSLADRERRKIPDFQRVVTAAADDPLPVGAETHAHDTK